VRILKAIVTWTLQVLVGAMFLMVGTGKFREPVWPGRFAHWGYPDGFHLVVGVLEVAGAVCLLVPRISAYGAALLMVVMTGAALTHLAHGEMRQLSAPLVFLVLLALVAWLRRRSALRPSGGRSAITEPQA
jgi:putative oxidoreductase